VGVLAIRRGTRFAAANPEDERERGRVPGPVNVPAVLAAAAALRARQAERHTIAARHHHLVDRIRAAASTIPDVQVVGDPVHRLPHIVTFSSLYVSGEALLTELDKAGFAVSSGSSCTASTMTPSHVLVAMGALSQGNIRVSLPWRVADEDIDRFLDVLPGLVATLRESAPIAPHVQASGDGADATLAADDILVIDTLGRRCPIPVIELAKRITGVEIGRTVAVWADDVAAKLDLPAWCELRGHTYLGRQPVPGRPEPALAHLIRREH
jgi:cysteine desulfurase